MMNYVILLLTVLNFTAIIYESSCLVVRQMFIGKGISSLLVHPGLTDCPVGVLQRYVDLSGIDLSSPLPLFRPLVFHRSSSTYTLRSGKISYTTFRDILRNILSQLGYNPNDYSLHSSRSGDITSAVRKSGNSIPETS